jgi:hypothetical protein
LTGDTTITPSNVKPGGQYTMVVTQDATGTRKITWSSDFKFAGGQQPVLTATPNGVDVFTFFGYTGGALLGIGASDFK